jgi:hypothetical protein
MTQLRTSPQIHKLARDLGIKIKKNDDPVTAVLQYCERRVKSMMGGVTDCGTLSQMLDWIANKVGTSFEIISSDEDLERIKQKYLAQREKAFVRLEDEFSDEVFGVTFKLLHCESWEPQYVSIIDCRGEKAARGYFTKWHEIAHLLTQTEQMRLVFRRTHSSANGGDPEERLMDVIAGRFGFYPPFVHSFIKEEISFEAIEDLRIQLCPEASQQSSLINFAKCWNAPCILLRAEMGLRKGEEAKLSQGGFYFADGPQYVLRAVHVSPNDLARDSKFAIYENMRVPEKSVIHRVFNDELLYAEAEEDLSWWESSSGRSLIANRIKVKARWWMQGVEALIIPI